MKSEVQLINQYQQIKIAEWKAVVRIVKKRSTLSIFPTKIIQYPNAQ